jgi:hypothetical protein
VISGDPAHNDGHAKVARAVCFGVYEFNYAGRPDDRSELLVALAGRTAECLAVGLDPAASWAQALREHDPVECEDEECDECEVEFLLPIAKLPLEDAVAEVVALLNG